MSGTLTHLTLNLNNVVVFVGGLASERFSTNFSKDLSKKYQSTVGGFAGTFGGVKQWLYFPKTEHLYFS